MSDRTGSQDGVEAPRPDLAPSRPTERHNAPPMGDVAVVALTVVALTMQLFLQGTPDLLLALVWLAILMAITIVAAWTAGAGRHPSRGSRAVGALAAALGSVAVVVLPSFAWTLAIPTLAVAAGLGRTGSTRLRFVALVVMVVAGLLLWLAG